MRDVLLCAPTVVRLDALEAGRFQASIQACLMLAADQTDRIKRSLDAVATALLKRGFQQVQRPLLSPDGLVGLQTVPPMFGWIPRVIPWVGGHWLHHFKDRWSCC